MPFESDDWLHSNAGCSGFPLRKRWLPKDAGKQFWWICLHLCADEFAAPDIFLFQSPSSLRFSNRERELLYLVFTHRLLTRFMRSLSARKDSRLLILDSQCWIQNVGFTMLDSQCRPTSQRPWARASCTSLTRPAPLTLSSDETQSTWQFIKVVSNLNYKQNPTYVCCTYNRLWHLLKQIIF